MEVDQFVLKLGWQVTLECLGRSRIEGLPHKAKGLLAILALVSPEPLSREAAGGILWPNANRTQRQVNLRQAIRAVRKKTQGVNFLTADRMTISLDPGLVSIEIVHGPDFLRQFSEPWFVLLRSSKSAAIKAARETAPDTREASVVSSFEDLLEWTIDHQPNQAYGLIYHASDIATSLPPQRALQLSKELLRRGSINHRLRGWANLLHAFSLFFCLEMEAAHRAFQDLRVAAINQGNYELMAMSAFYEVGCVLPMGGMDRAESVVASCSGGSHRLTSRAVARLDHAAGLTACCRAQYHNGLITLQQSVQSAARAGEKYELAYASANMAWIASSVGITKAATWAIEQFEQTDSNAHWRFNLTADLARIHNYCTQGEAESGLILCQSSLQIAQSLQAYGFEVYIRESLARCFTLLKEKKLAQEEIEVARILRHQIRWEVVPWDIDRINLALGKLSS